MNMKFYSCLLALGTFASAVLLSLTPVSAQVDSGSNNGNNVQPISGNGSNTTNNVQPVVVQIAPQALANVSTVLGQILGANPQALSSITTPDALVPSGAGQSVSDAATALASAVGGLNPSGVTGDQLNNAINAYNTYATALVESVGGEKAIAFLSSAGGVKSADGTSAPNLKSQLEKLRAAAQ
jgi:hypothetical protein